jgi:hypothetical protein
MAGISIVVRQRAMLLESILLPESAPGRFGAARPGDAQTLIDDGNDVRSRRPLPRRGRVAQDEATEIPPAARACPCEYEKSGP